MYPTVIPSSTRLTGGLGNRIKRFLRKRYGVLNLGKFKNLSNDTILDMYEYVYRVNVDSTFASYMKAMATSNLSDFMDT